VELTGGQLGFRRERSASNSADNSGLPGAGGCDDEVRQGMASALVVVAAWIACRSGARARPELAGAAAIMRAIRRVWCTNACGVCGEERGEGGVYIGGESRARS
jgi:hypothetical protein